MRDSAVGTAIVNDARGVLRPLSATTIIAHSNINAVATPSAMPTATGVVITVNDPSAAAALKKTRVAVADAVPLPE